LRASGYSLPDDSWPAPASGSPGGVLEGVAVAQTYLTFFLSGGQFPETQFISRPRPDRDVAHPDGRGSPEDIGGAGIRPARNAGSGPTVWRAATLDYIVS